MAYQNIINCFSKTSLIINTFQWRDNFIAFVGLLHVSYVRKFISTEEPVNQM